MYRCCGTNSVIRWKGRSISQCGWTEYITNMYVSDLRNLFCSVPASSIVVNACIRNVYMLNVYCNILM